MTNYSPEDIKFDDILDFNPNQLTLQGIKHDGIQVGRSLMKDEILRLVKATNPVPTKAVQKIINLIEEVSTND